MTTKLVFIGDNVRGAEYFKNNLLPDVKYIEVHSKDTIDVIRAKIQNLNISSLTHIGLVFENNTGRAPFIEYTLEETQANDQAYSSYLTKLSNQQPISNESSLIEEYDGTVRTNIPNFEIDLIEDIGSAPSFHYSSQYFSNDFITLINEIKTNPTLIIDIISCNIYQHPQFSILQNNGITVRYSTNITGYNGDWILESHNINVTPIYFTESVRNYPYQLGTTVPNTQIGSDWVIDDADKMYWLMSYGSNTTPPSPGGPTLASSFILTTDIDMGTQTAPINDTRSIGNTSLTIIATNRFIGTLKGNGTTLTIRTIDLTNFTGIIGNFGPLSGLTTSARVENLNVVFTTPSFIYNVPNSTTFNIFYGLLCGIMRSGTAENCTVSFANIGDISLTLTNTNTIATNLTIEAGLIVGRKQANCNIKNCDVSYTQNNSITITANSRYGARIGGLVGQSGSGSGITEISECQLNLINDLNIVVTSNNTTVNGEFVLVGGIIGATASQGGPNRTSVLNCSLTCRNLSLTGPTITGKNAITTNTYFGGFGGYMFYFNLYDNCRVTVSQLSVSYNDTSTGVGSATRNVFIGGFAGSQSTNSNSIIIQNCQINIGTFNIISNSGSLPYNNYIGGFTGESRNVGTILQILNSSCTITTLSITTSGTGVGFNYIGGSIGFALAGTVDNLDSIIQNCTFLFNDTNALIYSGGYMGFKENTIMLNSILLISDTFQTNANNTKTLLNSGYIGYIDGNVSNGVSNCSTTINTYNCISNGTNSNHINYIGGFLGRIIRSTQFISLCSVTITNMNITLNNSGINGLTRIGCVIGENNTAETSSIISNITNVVINISQPDSNIMFGGLIGNSINATVQACNTNIGSLTVQNTVTSRALYAGGIAGFISSTSNILNNTTNITNISLIARSTLLTYIGGLVGSINNTSSLQNCPTTIGENSYIESAAITSIDAAIGCLIGQSNTSGAIQNNTITYGNNLTLKANQNSNTIGITSTRGLGNPLNPSNNTIFVTYPLIFNSIFNGTGITFEGNNYLIQPQTITINTNPDFLIDLSDITLFFYLRPSIPVNNTVPPCCIANVCDANPQVADYDNRNVVTSKGGAQLVKDVSDFYAAAAAGQIRPNAPPIFKTYGQMMDWRQRQNRR